jgi:beta-lactamase superfamily II metal-dependent hydrolase
MPSNPKLTALFNQGHCFATFPDASIYDSPAGTTIQHLIFGDYITPPKDSNGKYKKWTASLTKTVGEDIWINVRSRQEDGWIKLDQIELKRLLEVNFVDIGQGDGCHLVTPSDEHYIIDAGKKDNMYRFLRWRFNLNKPGGKLPKFHAIISHPDDDHWGGFVPLMAKPPAGQIRAIKFDKLYLNGIIQRAGSKIGETIKVDNSTYLTEFIPTTAAVKKILKKEGKKSEFEQFLIGALENTPDLPIEALWKEMNQNEFVVKKNNLSIEVLAPIPEIIDGKKSLLWFDPKLDEIGKTKNGHSIVLMARIGKMRVMLGGDLNSKSADYLMEKYSGVNVRKLRKDIMEADAASIEGLKKQMDNVIQTCREFLQADVAKSCHHGSHDITDEFLNVVNPIATVISSGDEESHCHPRPETLGAIGKYGRGARPLIYSTELARSSPEFIELSAKDFKTDKIKQRLVATYGLITLRTDGERAIIAQKLEKGRSQYGKLIKWHIDELIWNDERKDWVTHK